MKAIILTGIDINGLHNVLKGCLDSFHVLYPTEESAFSQELILKMKSQFKEMAIGVSYKENSIESVIRDLDYDLIISIGWRRILGRPFFEAIEGKRIYNIHPAILPDYKGYHAEPYVIINGEQEHGITAHVLTEGLDDGPIVLQWRFKTNIFSTTKSIKNIVSLKMPEFIENFLILYKNNQLNEKANDPAYTKVIAPKRSPSDSEVDPHLSLLDAFNFIKACDAVDYPAYFTLNGERVYIKLYRASDADRENRYDI